MYVLWRMIVKEFLQLRQDKKLIPTLFVGPLFQLMALGYAANLDVTAIPTVLVDQGPPTAFYATPLDDGRCYVTIAPASDRNLGDIGPFPSDPEQAACLAQLQGG